MTLRLALFSDSTPQLLARALEQTLQAQGQAVELRCWAFTSPLAVQEELAAFAPDVVLFWACAEAEQFPEVEPLLALPYRWMVYTMATRDDGTCGHLALTSPSALRARILAWNAQLIALAQRHPQLSLIDLDLLQSRLGRHTTFDARLWASASLALTPTAVQALATQTATLLRAQAGALRKIVVTDLDGTLWDGIVSEEGVEAINPAGPGREAYRQWLRRLAARGVLLAVASRNDREVALEALAREDLGLTVQDFVAIEADWGAKSEMLKRIAEKVHLGLDAFVFIDDRAEVRGEVRAALPEVAVPEMPEDAARWVEFLAEQQLFEVAQVTDEDRLRAASLQADHARQAAAEALSPEAYLASLEQELIPEPLGPRTLARAAQLTQRCNQFNMRGTRHTEAELAGKQGWVYRLKDKYGDLGIVSAVVLEGDFIETWVLSCRALNRGVEALILDHLKAQGPLCGEYRPTDRNQRCRDLYQTYGVPLR